MRAADEEEEIPESAARPSRRAGSAGDPATARPGAPHGGVARLFFGLGRTAGIRPQDLVGAIAGESGLRGRDIGAIEITDRFSLVEVPEARCRRGDRGAAGHHLKGRKPTVRRERRPPPRR